MTGGEVWVHWLHLMAAMLWVGGMFATALVVQPVLRRLLPPDQRMSVYRLIGARFTWVQWGTWGALAATGGVKLWGLRGSPEVYFGPFGAILAAKLSLVAVMVALSLLHGFVWGPALLAAAPGSREFSTAAARMAFWGKINLLIIAGIVFCAVLLRFNPW